MWCMPLKSVVSNGEPATSNCSLSRWPTILTSFKERYSCLNARLDLSPLSHGVPIQIGRGQMKPSPISSGHILDPTGGTQTDPVVPMTDQVWDGPSGNLVGLHLGLLLWHFLLSSRGRSTPTGRSPQKQSGQSRVQRSAIKGTVLRLW